MISIALLLAVLKLWLCPFCLVFFNYDMFAVLFIGGLVIRGLCRENTESAELHYARLSSLAMAFFIGTAIYIFGLILYMLLQAEYLKPSLFQILTTQLLIYQYLFSRKKKQYG
ncbi:MAG: hypothetical protein ACOC4D_01935 [Bacteroidota bacterium]